MAESIALKGMPLDKKLAFILDKTYEVLAEVGYNQITLDMVAERVGVSKGTISYHFKNKEQLMVKTALHIAEIFFPEVVLKPKESVEPKQRLFDFIDSIWFTYFHNEKYPEVFQVYYDLWFHGMHNKPLYEATTSVDERFYSVLNDMLGEVYSSRGEEAGAEKIFTKVVMIAAAVDGAAKIVLSGTKDVDPALLLQEVRSTVSKIID